MSSTFADHHLLTIVNNLQITGSKTSSWGYTFSNCSNLVAIKNSVIDVNNGYYFFFFTYFGGQCREKSACRITKLSDVAKFEKYIKKGTILEEKLQERFPDIACGDDIGDYYVCWTSDLTEKIIRVEMQGSRMKVTEIFSNYDSVLTYLLPQDLALIS